MLEIRTHRTRIKRQIRKANLHLEKQESRLVLFFTHSLPECFDRFKYKPCYANLKFPDKLLEKHNSKCQVFRRKPRFYLKKLRNKKPLANPIGLHSTLVKFTSKLLNQTANRKLNTLTIYTILGSR